MLSKENEYPWGTSVVLNLRYFNSVIVFVSWPRSKFPTLELGLNSHGRLMRHGLYHDNDNNPMVV